MPKRTDISSILLIGSGPIVIGQACEFDYSGTQAIKALKQEGYRVVLVNSNPATIMTDPSTADRTYIEPLTAEFVERVIATEKVDAVLPTMGGQTALNLALELAERGVFKRYGVELIGASVQAIEVAEDREKFKNAMTEIGLESARSGVAYSVKEASELAAQFGFPLVLRPSRTLGGTGGGIVRDPRDLPQMVSTALAASPNHEVLVEESLLGWKEIELEVMRDNKDNAVIVCAIENLDPMGVHTGDSITVAPLQTVTDKEYQLLRDAAIKVLRRVGVSTGGSNVQFAINPKTGRTVVIEMNPRVSRSSALASKATGFPIAKIAAKLAVGYTLDEIQNDITKVTPACFEPSIDYVVVKIPRFNFEKFPGSDRRLGTQMKSVGEVLSFGRTFREALQKALCSMEQGRSGFDAEQEYQQLSDRELLEQCAIGTPERLWQVAEALRRGIAVERVVEASAIDPWFVREIAAIISEEQHLRGASLESLDRARTRRLKSQGFSDKRIAELMNVPESELRGHRQRLGVRPSFKAVDTCAAEFSAETPYLYSTYDLVDEMPATVRRKVVILGSGPNRIGQGIEFDYCCVHAAIALRERGIEAIMVNCNPETVSTDYDTSDRLYFEPLTFESVIEIIDRERPIGVIVQFGGQTPLKLAGELARRGVPILGTSVESIDIAEDRQRFSRLVEELKLKQPPNGSARSADEAFAIAQNLGYPLMIRPSFVLGGRAMRVLHNDDELQSYIRESVKVSEERPVLLDRYLHNAVEVDIDAVCDGRTVVIAGVMEHIERAGIHSGDSSCALPPQTLSIQTIEELKRLTRELAIGLNVIGLINVQAAVLSSGDVFILEVNPRASRTVPFVGKVSGVPWAQAAVRLMLGETVHQVGLHEPRYRGRVAVKSPVFPFSKFPGVDTILGPEMRSTGEVMGMDRSFAGAFFRAQTGAGVSLPTAGKVFMSVCDDDKSEALEAARAFLRAGFSIVATAGTSSFLRQRGVLCEAVNKVRDGSPHIVDLLGQGEISLVVNTPEGSGPLLDSRSIRLVANALRIPTYTTIAAAHAAAISIRDVARGAEREVFALQDLPLSDREVENAVSA